MTVKSLIFIIISATILLLRLFFKHEFDNFSTLIWELMIDTILCFAILKPVLIKASPTTYNQTIWNIFSTKLLFFSILFITIPSLTILLQIGFFIYVLTKYSKMSTTSIKGTTSNLATTTGATQVTVDSSIVLPKEADKTNTEFVEPSSFDSMYSLSDDELLKRVIMNELGKNTQYDYKKMIPFEIKKRKQIFSLILSVMIFIYVSMIFFHFPLATYVIGLVILIISFISLNSYDFVDYLKKKIKERPDEKMSNIIMSELQNLTSPNTAILKIIGTIIAIVVPLVIFYKPIIIYEPYEDGYAVRYYTFGVTEFTSATIPETHNDKPILSLRGNTFSNMPFLTEISLPDTIVEIRGQAFKNCNNLKKVNLPKELKYLGGEAFKNDANLETIVLPEGLEEIKGNTFENCVSLKEINIPDKVTRIGGHAFYECIKLSKVEIKATSQLKEIGSSAFRKCNSLNEITVPTDTIINERAFKESPTKVYKYTTEYTKSQNKTK